MNIKEKITNTKEKFKATALYEFIILSINTLKNHPKIISAIIIAIFITGVALYPIVDKVIGNKNTVVGTVTGTNINDEFSGDVNINTATIYELSQLPSIDEETAENIVKYRNAVGKFECIEDIQNVIGIEPEVYEKIKNYITV